MLEILIAVAAIAVAPWLLWKLWKWLDCCCKKLKLALRLPGPPALPILGNAITFSADPRVQLKLVEDILRKYGEYVRFWLGPDLNIFISNPDDIKMLLSSPRMTRKGPVYKVLQDLIGQGMLGGGNVWRNHRKLVTPSYNKAAVQSFSHVFNEEATALADALRGKDPKRTFNIYCDVVNATTRCVCQTLMGQSKKEFQNIKGLDEIVLKTPSLYNRVYEKMTKWQYQLPFLFRLSGGAHEITHFLNLINIVFGEMVSNRMKALGNKQTVKEETKSIIDRLVVSGELTEQEIIWEAFTLFTTCQEAAAKVASGVLLFLAHLPEWQDRVYNEIVERVPENEFVSDEQLKSLQYLDMVYKEVIRYLAISPIIQRTAEEEIKIDSGRITIPAGTSLIIPIHTLHRDPNYWEEPDKIKPERFMPENVMKRNPNAFIPFALGPMDCLGRVFGTSMIKTLVVRVVRHYRLEAEGRLEDLDISVAISVRFADGYNLRISPRKPTNNGTVQA